MRRKTRKEANRSKKLSSLAWNSRKPSLRLCHVGNDFDGASQISVGVPCGGKHAQVKLFKPLLRGQGVPEWEEETVTPLARMLNVQPNLSYGKGEEQRVAKLAHGALEPMLIVWEHENILKLGGMIAPTAELPNEWPSDRFDLIWVFRPGPNGEYSFEQVPQLLLAGDSASPIAN